MAGNNSAGARSIKYGHMVSNVLAIDALLADGSEFRCEQVMGEDRQTVPAAANRYADLIRQMQSLYDREADEIARRFPTVARNVAGYNIDRIGRSHRNSEPSAISASISPRQTAQPLEVWRATTALGRVPSNTDTW